jgi:hypothetical protein
VKVAGRGQASRQRIKGYGDSGLMGCVGTEVRKSQVALSLPASTIPCTSSLKQV